MTDRNVTLSTEGKDFNYPILEGSVGPEVFDVRKLYGQTGMFTYDPGFTSTASCQSAITYIDGEKGVLLHRGYPIDQLAENSTFMAVISARSCSVSRSSGCRKKSVRTVDRRSRPARRAGAFWSAAGAAIGHSSGSIDCRVAEFG